MNAFFFVPLLVAAWMLGFLVAAHAAHYFLAIVESSATGMARNVSPNGKSSRKWIRDGVQWPDDLFVDYFAKTFYFAYVIGIWAGPAVLVGRLIAGHSIWSTVIAGAAFWLFFPVGLLSSLASESRWTPLSSDVFVALCKRPGKTLGFYLLSIPVLAVLWLTFDWILIHTGAVAIGRTIALCPLAVLAFFIYARLLGRLGLVVAFAHPHVNRKAKPRLRRPKRVIHAYDERTRMFGPREAMPDEVPADAQPPDLPPIETPFDGPLTGYTVDFAGTAPVIDEPKPLPRIMHFDDDDATPITVAPAPDGASTDREKIAAMVVGSSEQELALRLRERPTEPRNPFGLEVVSFLFDSKTIDPWIRLTLGLMLMALFQHGLNLLRPV